MSEEKLTSNVLEIEAKSQAYANSADNKESYKSLSEDIGLDNVASDTAKNSNMVRENGDSVQDGADEKMLGSSDKEALALKDIDVKFISGDPNLNGDAKIEIGSVEKAFTGMTKDELMKYANDPFWVKLRWILFVAFWALWIAMLVGAVMIIVLAPKCAAPTPLAWYERGPLITIKDETEDNIELLKDIDVQGVIYELPGEETYLVDTKDDIAAKIKRIVEKYEARDIKVVLDLTPNYVTQEDELFKQAKDAENGDESLGAFVTSNAELNWLKFNASNNERAFVKHGKHYFLSQFGDNIDLRLDNPLAEQKLKNVLAKLVELGVKGFRLRNGKHLKINEAISNTSVKSNPPTGAMLGQYAFDDHSQSTYVEGLGDLINKFRNHVRNITNEEGFLSLTDSISDHEEVFFTRHNTVSFDLPKLEVFRKHSTAPSSSVAVKIHNLFLSQDRIISLTSTWSQLQFTADFNSDTEPTAFYMFTSLLRAVQIAPYDFFKIDLKRVETIQKEREKGALQFGNFEYMLGKSNETVAYTRVKSGNPGYFVVYNPSANKVNESFNSAVFGNDTSLEVFMKSANFTGVQAKAKYVPVNIEMPPQSAAIFTFVPK